MAVACFFHFPPRVFYVSVNLKWREGGAVGARNPHGTPTEPPRNPHGRGGFAGFVAAD